MTVRFDVLGELKVWDGGHSRGVTAEKQRTILAVLIAARGLNTSVDRLLDSVWESSHPSNGRSTLRYHISKLRSIIQPGVNPADSVIRTTATGYRLESTLVAVDAWGLQDRVESCSLVASVRPIEAIETLQQAVDSYGLYLNDFSYAEFAQQPRREWDEFVISTALTCADLLVESGGPDGAAALLRPLLEANPYRESIASKLVLALHDADRQVEALRTYDHVREQLVGVGVEPGPELRSSLDRVLAAGMARPQQHPVRHNLPVQIQRLVGRDEALTRLSEMLSDSRLVRVAGLPGIGKSALVSHYASTNIDSFRDGVIRIGSNPSAKVDQDLARVLTDVFKRPVDAANAAVAVSEMNCLVMIDGTAPYGDITSFVGELLSGTEAKVVVTSDDVRLNAPVLTVQPLDREASWSLFESLGGATSGTIGTPDLLMEIAAGIPALIRFSVAASGAETLDVLHAEVGAASADLLDSALAVVDDRSLRLLAVASTFSGPVSLLDIGGIDKKGALPDILGLVDGGWLTSTHSGVEVPAVVRERLRNSELVDSHALVAHARLVSGWSTIKAGRRFVDTEHAIVHLVHDDVDDAVELFDRVARPLWDTGRYGSLARAAAAIAACEEHSGSALESVLYYGAYAGLRTGDVQLSKDCQERFEALPEPDPDHAIESALLAADVAWFEGLPAIAVHEYARANTLATSQGDSRAVLGAFGEAIVLAYTSDHPGFVAARDRVVSGVSTSTESLRAEVLGIDALLGGDPSSAAVHFEAGLGTFSTTDRRSLQRRLLECHLIVDDESSAKESWAEIEADEVYTGVPLDPPTSFAGSILFSRYRSGTEAIRLLQRGARSLRSSPAAMWVATGLATASAVGRPGPHRERIEIAMARLKNKTGIALLPPFATMTASSHGPVEIDEAIELLLATEAPTR